MRYRIHGTMLWALSVAIASGQTSVDLRTQSKDVDFSGAVSTKPFQTGATIPATCSPGQMFFLITAPAGSNVYGCQATNVWVLESGGSGGGGGAATAINQLTDAVCVRSAATLVTCSFPSGGTDFGDANYSIALATGWTLTISSGVTAATTFFQYWNPASPTTISIDTTGSSFTGVACNSGCTLVNTSVTGYPPDVKPISRLTAGLAANTWDSFTNCVPTNAAGCIDDRAFLSLSVLNAGANLTSTVGSHGIKTIGVDTTSALSWTGAADFSGASLTRPVQSGGSNPSVCAAGKDLFINTAATPQLELCGAGNTWITMGSAGIFTIYNAPLVVCQAGTAITQFGWGNGGTIGAQCSTIGALGSTAQAGLLQSGASGDVVFNSFVVPSNLLSIDVIVNGFPGTTSGNSLTWTARIGCIAGNGTTFSGGAQNSGTAASISATTSNSTAQFVMSGVPISGCNANDQMYLAIARTGSYTSTYFISSIEVRATRTLP